MGSELTRLGWCMLDEVCRYLGGRPLEHRIAYDRLHLMA
jgi:hypothetical protein